MLPILKSPANYGFHELYHKLNFMQLEHLQWYHVTRKINVTFFSRKRLVLFYADIDIIWTLQYKREAMWSIQ